MGLRVIIGVALILLLTACGQKGPLRLPDQPEENGPATGSEESQ